MWYIKVYLAVAVIYAIHVWSLDVISSASNQPRPLGSASVWASSAAGIMWLPFIIFCVCRAIRISVSQVSRDPK